MILAGGRGSRLGGVNKALLRVPGGEATILARQLSVFAGRFVRGILVLGRDQQEFPVDGGGIEVAIVRDRLEGAGPLAGIESALAALETPLAFVCAADMPFLSGALLDLMGKTARDGRALVPRREGRPEPLHAIYPAGCLAQVTTLLDQGGRAPRDLFDRIPVDWMDEPAWAGVEGAGRSFENLNSPSDLERVGSRPPGGDR